MEKDQEKHIPLNLIDRPAKISRETIDPERVRELAESIREHGQLQAIEVRPVNGRYEIVYGDRRFLAHKLLGLEKIRATVRERDDRETVIVRGIENLQRVNLTASEEGMLYVELRDEGKLGLREMARKTGKSAQTITRYLRFMKHDAVIRKAVDEKRISLNTLEVLDELDDPGEFEYFFNMAAANGITEKTARLWVDDHLKTKMNTYHDDIGGGSESDVVTESKPIFLTCESCHNPVELKNVRHVPVCVGCAKKIAQGSNVKS